MQRMMFARSMTLLATSMMASVLYATEPSQSSNGQTAHGYSLETDELVPYTIYNGLAVIDDIVIGTHEAIQRFGIPSIRVVPWTSNREVQTTEIEPLDNHVGTSRRWPNNTVYYSLAAASSAARNAFMQATAHITAKTGVRFVARTNQTNYIRVTSNQAGACYSYIGMVGGGQELSLGRGCEYMGIAAHELLHALGWDHEQNRPDRARFVTINWSNIPTANQHNFRITRGADPIGGYDFRSIMHYGAWAFAINRSIPTIRPVDPNIPLSQLGQRNGLTNGDTASVKHFYPPRLQNELGISLNTKQLILSKNGKGTVLIDLAAQDPSQVQLSATTSNHALASNTDLSFRYLGGNQYQLTIQPAAEATGMADLTVQVVDHTGQLAHTNLSIMVLR
ncbi:M12 family metallopeptidase [Chitinivorax sp. B]|uniref:M12 family metallopeptidase n=1 Tax=Chitinivorax sp. B TaxID=2502235 RepID=UPI0010F94CA5|nr:M12 family metallopeptidase [Chitinivorax sp. B]